MSNYGWVPRPDDESDDYLERLALLVARRPRMEMIEISNTLQGFIAAAHAAAAPPPPIDDELVVGGHASRRGDWMVDPYPYSTLGPWTDYVTLEISLSDPNYSLRIPDDLVGDSPIAPDSPAPTPRAFHAKGCNIGRAAPWLAKLREALGGHVRVTAPRHYHGVSTNGTPGVTSIEAIEWMGYQFVVFQKTPVASVNALATAFFSQGHTRPDGVRIPLSAFQGWLTLVAGRRLKHPSITERKRVRLPLGRDVGGHRYAEGVVGLYVRTPASSVVFQTFRFSDPDSIPASDQDRVAALSAWFLSESSYRDDYSYPMYKQHGYPTLADMIRGLEWRFNVVVRPDSVTMDCIGGRYEYELLVPIAAPGRGGTLAPTKAPLIYNHIPEAGPPVKPPAFDEDSPFYYGTAP